MNELKNYKKVCNQLKDEFLKNLYPKNPEHYDDGYWIARDIGGVFSWGDWFVSPKDMADFFEYELTSDEFFDWYDQSLGEGLGKKDVRYNMKNFKKLKGGGGEPNKKL